jgi:NAD+ diphosphatase
MRDAEAVTFAGGTLDRAAHLRGDGERQEALRAAPGARCLPLWRGKPLVDSGHDRPTLGWLALSEPLVAGAPGEAIFLGLAADGAPRFARDVSHWPGPVDAAEAAAGFVDTSRVRHPDLPERLEFADLRAIMALLGPGDAGDAAAAKGIFGWHETHRFCARCGGPSRMDEAGWRRVCPACGAQHFPRTDPVVIMLILHGNSVLLGRSAAWPEGMYSLLAGFMEPGESIEAAVRRETREEAGVTVGAVDYLSSQPWPFPSSLMIGCRGMALDPSITRDPTELEDARWVSREGVLAGLTGADPAVRPARKGSIARFLLERWLADRLG